MPYSKNMVRENIHRLAVHAQCAKDLSTNTVNCVKQFSIAPKIHMKINNNITFID